MTPSESSIEYNGEYKHVRSSLELRSPSPETACGRCDSLHVWRSISRTDSLALHYEDVLTACFTTYRTFDEDQKIQQANQQRIYPAQ